VSGATFATAARFTGDRYLRVTSARLEHDSVASLHRPPVTSFVVANHGAVVVERLLPVCA
jgi:hypothetical protein